MLYAALAVCYVCFIRSCYESGRQKALREVGHYVAFCAVKIETYVAVGNNADQLCTRNEVELVSVRGCRI